MDEESRFDEAELPGADAELLTDDERARLQAVSNEIASLRARLVSGTGSVEDVVGLFRATGQIPDPQRMINAVHVPEDAGDLAPALDLILRRIPDGWGRWISCERGWYRLIVETDGRLTEVEPRYIVLQVKEKLGELRYYFDLPDDLDEDRAASLRSLMFEITWAAEEVSITICERCGDAGERRRNALGWLKTLCDSCADSAEPRFERMFPFGHGSLTRRDLQAAA